MKYFELFVDGNYIPPKPIGWYGKLDKKSWEQKKFYEMPKHSLFMVEHHMQLVFTDIITFPCFMISERIKNVIQKYDSSIGYAQIVFYHKERKQNKAYYLPFLKEIEGRKKKEDVPVGVIRLGKENICNNAIIKMREENQSRIIVRLDLLESILRRGAIGIGVKEVKVVEGE